MFSPSYTQQKTDQTGTDSPWKWHPYGHLYTSFLYIKLRVNLGKCTFSVAVHGIILKVSGLFHLSGQVPEDLGNIIIIRNIYSVDQTYCFSLCLIKCGYIDLCINW